MNQSEIMINLPVAAPIFLIGFRDNTPTNKVKREIDAHIALELLFGETSDFYTRLYEQNLINDTFTLEYTIDRTYAYAVLGGESSDPVKVKHEVEKIISQEIKFDDVEFERIKKLIIGRYIKEFDDVGHVARAIITNEFEGTDLFSYINVCKNTEKFEVERVAKELLKAETIKMSVVNPLEAQ